MVAPRSLHYAVILQILRYLKDTLFHRLHFSSQSSLTLQAYSDADWVRDPSTVVPLQDIAFFLVTPSSLGASKNNLLLLVLVLRRNIKHLLTPLLSSFGYVGFSRI